MSETKIRLYVDQALAAGQPVAVGADAANYLFNVMRLAVGGQVALFNGRDGEWRAVVTQAGKRAGVLTCIQAQRPQMMPCDLWLVFAPIKKVRTDFIVEKAVELGVSRIVPVQTRHTNSERIRQDRLQAHAIEAAEQCGATFVPEVADLVGLDRLLAVWPAGRRLMWCDEALAGAVGGASGAQTGLVGFMDVGLGADDAQGCEAGAAVRGGADDPGRGGVGDAGRGGGGGAGVGGAIMGGASMGGASVRGAVVGGAGVGGAGVGTTSMGGASLGGAGVGGASVGGAGPWAVLIGPEGGFAADEQARLRGMPGVHAVSLGPRILRADTAAVAALVLWQSALGDWR